MDNINYDWDKLFQLYDEYDVDGELFEPSLQRKRDRKLEKILK